MELNKTVYDIHVFGDSHSRIYSSYYLANYSCNVYYTGPITMHRVGRDKLTIDQLKELSKQNYKEYLPKCKPEYKHMSYPIDDKIKERDIVIFVFGEIDIRNHYAKQIEKGRNNNEILGSLVNNYIDTILSNRKQYNNVKFGLQSINPPVDEKNLNEPIKEYPINGTIEQRIKATKEINKMLKKKCEQHNLIYIDTSTYYENDDSLFPMNGLCDKAKLFELDTRIKDSNVHVHMEHPDGIEHAFKIVNLPINLKYYAYKKKCKYPTSLNRFQRDNVIRVRTVHYMFVFFLFTSLLLPNRYFIITLVFWVLAIILNIAIANGIDCSFNVIEFRSSNCNNMSLFDEIGIPRSMGTIVWIMLYIFGTTIVTFRTYYHFNNKNLFNLKFGLKFLK